MVVFLKQYFEYLGYGLGLGFVPSIRQCRTLGTILADNENLRVNIQNTAFKIPPLLFS